MVDIETAGVGDISGKIFMWSYDDEIVTAVFDTGEFMQFEHGPEGWYGLLMMGLFLVNGL